jgi:hypothetical protein
MAKKIGKKAVKASAVVENPEVGKTPDPELVKTAAAIEALAQEIEADQKNPGRIDNELELALSPAELNKKLLLHSYHGSRNTERKVAGVTGKQFPPAVVAHILKENNIHFTTAEARDGTILRAYNKVGDEECRFFFSTKGRYSGMFGVSGKVRGLLELSCREAEFSWEQQGSKNYYFSPNTEALVRFLGAK